MFTLASWRANFRGGRPVTVCFRGTRVQFVGKLDDDPAHVAEAFASLTERQGTLRKIGVDIRPDHRPTPADAVAVDRCLVRFSPRQSL